MGINVEFILLGDDFPARSIADRLKIPNPIIESKGQIRQVGPTGNIKRKATCTSLMYESGYIDTIDVNDPWDIIYNMISSKVPEIKGFINKYKLAARFVVVINLSENPIISLQKKVIYLASELDSEIEFDSYIHQRFSLFGRKFKNIGG